MNTPQQLAAMQARDYITACELADCPALDTVDAGAPTAQGAVVASTLLAFAEGTSGQTRQDVMDSFLFATRAANNAADPEQQAAQWYATFNEALAQLGWFSSQWSYARHHASEQRFSMDQLGLQILASALAAAALPGPASAAMLKVAGDAVKALRGKEEPLRLFESRSRSHQGAQFRMASCVESNGLVNLVMGAVSFQASTQVTDVLFWNWSSNEVQTWRGENSLVLNSDLYALNRELIRSRLAASSRQAIAEFDI